MTTKIDAAISRSIQTSSAAAVTLTEAEFDDLLCEHDGIALWDDGTHDVWGTDANGNEWRLCVTIED